MRWDEDETGWRLSLVNGFVQYLTISYQFTMSLRDGWDEAYVQVENNFRLSGPNLDVVLDPKDFATLGPALPLFMKKVLDVWVAKSGHLKMQFGDGFLIESDFDYAYESWEVGGPFIGATYICTPGGRIFKHVAQS